MDDINPIDKNSISKDFVLEALTRWNYFPTQKKENEYTPLLHSKSFTPLVTKELSNLNLTKNELKYGFDQVEFRLTRHNSTSRILSIPHPHAYAILCHTLFENLDKIESATQIYKNENSIIKPSQDYGDKIITMDYEDPLEKTNRLVEQSFGKKFMVKADISNCFPSIYTHALPWALVGFEHAKANRSKDLWFNKLDTNLRTIKRGETQGIGIGPAISNFIAEIILSKIDQELRQKYAYYRYIDDYTCYAKDHSEAISFIYDLENQLKRFKLTLNPRKTEILELPSSNACSWVIELQSRSPIGYLTTESNETISIKHSARDVIRHLELALHLNKKDPDGSVLKFAAKSVMHRLDSDAKEPFTHYLLNLSFTYPHLLPLLDSILSDSEVNAEKYTRHLNDILLENYHLGRSDGMCWPLYYIHKHKLKLENKNAEAIVKSQDCTALLLLEHFESYHGASIPLIDSLEEGYDQHRYWLLTYQLLKWGRLAEKHLTPAYEVMLKHEVSFSALDQQTGHSEQQFEAMKIQALFSEEQLPF